MVLATWQPTSGGDLQTKDAVYTLSAMTSGIRRNWIEALRKTVRPTSAPDVTKYVLGWTRALGRRLPCISECCSGSPGGPLAVPSGPQFLYQQNEKALSILGNPPEVH